MKVLFTGFDSAWGGRQRGAICDLAGEAKNGRLVLRVQQPPEPVDWNQAIERCKTRYSDTVNHVFSIDQGLIVPNREGMRPVERLLASALMNEFRCGAHASNHKRASCYGPSARIWDLMEALEGRGYRHEPLAVANRTQGRFFFECYPHPALIALFNLNRTLPYKVCRGTSEGWQELLGYLRSLSNAELPIEDVTEHVAVELPWNKQNEDKLDALIAAYVAAYVWHFGTARSVILGSLTDGYIVTPFNARTWPLYERTFGGQVNPVGIARARRPKAEPAATPNAIPDGLVELVVTDTGNLWCKTNDWMPRDRCVGWHLELTFRDLDGEPVLTFVPFANAGETQGGMKPADDDTKLEWKLITDGATRSTPRRYRVQIAYSMAPHFNDNECGVPG